VSQLAGFADEEYRRLMAGFARLGGDIKEVLRGAVERGAAMVEQRAKERHFFLGTGRATAEEEKSSAYVFVNPDGTPRFRVRTAALVNSIQIRDRQDKGDVVSASVAASQEYAADVENGGAGRRAFPFMRPALEEAKPEMLDDAKATLQERIASWKP
jgi:hypothetical protein